MTDYIDFKLPTRKQEEMEQDWKRQQQRETDRALAKRDVERAAIANQWIKWGAIIFVGLGLIFLVVHFHGTPSLSQ